MLVKLISLFGIDASGPEIDQGAQLRWRAESAWFPYAFVGNQIRWEAIDHDSARATLLSEGLPVSALFEIDDDGKLASIRADRYCDVGRGRAVLTPWSGRYSDYRLFNGFLVPSYVEVAWELESGSFAYARFQVTVLEYNASERF